MSHSTHTPPAARNGLLALARQLTLACPDMRQQARDIARQLLARHRLGGLDPDKVYWHRFSDQVSSPRAFSGWVHYQPPIHSLTLPELVMARFSAEDSQAPDDLDTQTGFYRAGAKASAYDEHNEVPLLPSEVLGTLWSLDLKARFKEGCTTFWRQHAEDYRLLAKATLIAQALQARQHGVFTNDDLGHILDAVAGAVQAPPTLLMLRATYLPPSSARVSFLRIGQHEASDVLHLVSGSRHYLYVPGEPDPWQVFKDLPALHWWLLMHNNHAENRARFASHFPLRATLAEHGKQPLYQTLDLLYSTWGQDDQTLLDPPGPVLTGDVFTALRDRAQARMDDDAELRLTSNATLRKQIWLGYLGAFDRVFGPLGALDWPVALACVGAGIAEVGLNLDLAINAPTGERRHQAILGATLASVNLLFNGAFLWGAWHPTVPAPLPAAPTEALGEEVTLAQATPERLYPTDSRELLDHFHSNKILRGYQPATEGALRGVYALDGAFYIELDGASYQVRHATALDGWVIVDPLNPFSFQRNVPVRLNAHGDWELISRPGLAGGGQALGCLNNPTGAALDYQAPTPTPYDLPAARTAPLRKAAADPGSPLLNGDDYDFFDDPEGSEAMRAFRQRRQALEADAQAFFQGRAITPRPTPAALPVSMNARVMLETLYGERNGLVLGEAHHHSACRRFLITHMRDLRKLGVRTLYMEHLLADFHEADLAAALQRRRLMPELSSYLTTLDNGFWVSEGGTATYRDVVKSASEQGLRVVPLDCLASYRIGGLEDPNGNLRQQMMNFYAHQVIKSDPVTAGGGRWIALVGNTHASAFRGIEGLDGLEGVGSVRFEDVAPGGGTGLSLDPGLYVDTNDGLPQVTLRSDYLYRSESFAMAPAQGAQALAEHLTAPRTFQLGPGDNGWVLSLRLPNQQWVTAPVAREGGLYLVNLPQLPQVHHVHYTSITALGNDLKRLGFRPMP